MQNLSNTYEDEIEDVKTISYTDDFPIHGTAEVSGILREMNDLQDRIDKLTDDKRILEEYNRQLIEANNKLSLPLDKNPYSSAEEESLMRLLKRAWDLFNKLKQTHPDHYHQFKSGIDSCEDVMIHRIVQRDYPFEFPTVV